MAARAGITRQQIVTSAVAWLDADPDHQVALGPVARALGIRTQSLYAHVDGADGLARAVAIAGLEALRDTVADAATGHGGRTAAGAIISAHLDFATARPALYLASLLPPAGDPDLHEAVTDVGRPLEIVLTSLGLDAEERVHWTRLFLAAVTGFVHLRIHGRLALPVDPADTGERLVEMLVSQLPDGPATSPTR